MPLTTKRSSGLKSKSNIVTLLLYSFSLGTGEVVFFIIIIICSKNCEMDDWLQSPICLHLAMPLVKFFVTFSCICTYWNITLYLYTLLYINYYFKLLRVFNIILDNTWLPILFLASELFVIQSSYYYFFASLWLTIYYCIDSEYISHSFFFW